MNMKPKHLIRQLFLSSIMMVVGDTKRSMEEKVAEVPIPSAMRIAIFPTVEIIMILITSIGSGPKNDLMETMTYSISNSRCVSAVT